MGFKKSWLGAVAGLALVATTAGSALAVPVAPSDSADVDIVVTSSGVLTVQVTESEAFDDMTYSFSDQHSLGQLTVRVTDMRGNANGWNFNLRATGDFDGQNTTDSIPVGGLGLAFDYVSKVAGNPNLTGVTGSTIAHVSTTGQQIASASVGVGNGEYDFIYLGDLLVPGDTLVDTYKTTLIVEAPSAP